jgi:hypothetical protein
VQAADVLVRRELGLRAIDALTIEHVDGDVVTVRSRGAYLRATVARRDDERPRPVSCGAEPETVPAYELVDLVTLDRAA